MPSPKTSYLILYNTLSLTLWSTLLIRLLPTLFNPSQTYNTLGTYTQWTQTLALLEILHSLLGLVRSPLFTTALQVSSRLFLVHAIVAQFPREAAAENPFYASMLLAWSATEVVRYGFFAVALASAESEGEGEGLAGGERLRSVLTWLRYNTFFVLYPLGIGSEVMCIVRAMGAMKALARGSVGLGGDGVYGLAWWGCVLVLAVYVPGSWVLYTYMMAQRRKVSKGKGAVEKTKHK